MMDLLRQEIAALATTIVVKVGTRVLTRRDGQLDHERIEQLVEQVHRVLATGRKVVLVSSGAVGAGMGRLGLTSRPSDLAHLQAVAAIGQSSLVEAYERSLHQFGHHAAQILLTADDLEHRLRYLNARNTLLTLLELGAVPIINENDTVAVDEIKFGDNDTLSVLVTHVAQAGCLVILTDIDGVYDRDPRKDSSAKLVHDVMGWDPALESAAGDSKSLVGTGGMASKVRAAKRMWQSGLPMAILSGETVNGLVKLFDGETIGTFFHPAGHGMHAQERWLAWGALPKGTVVVDEGAHRALVQRKTSLLPSGVKGVKGHWETGDVIRILDLEGHEVARGVSGYSSQETDRVKGLKSSEISALLARKDVGELVHRDHMVIMEDL